MGRSLLLEGEATLGEVFERGGYATGMFGKWHLGDNYPFRPEDRGFGEVVRHGGGGVGQSPDNWNNSYFDDTYFHNGKQQKYEGFCTDVFFAEAKRFIQESLDSEKPFFAYISTNAPHGPLHCPEKYTKPYAEKLKPGQAIFFGMIANIDENVGRLRDWLVEKDIADNTIFIFMTDNGTAGGRQIFNSNMRGNKGSAYDGGHRVPFFLHWPAGGYDQPVDVNRLTAHIDVLPTLVELCELPKLENYKLDGRSLVPLLKDPNGDWQERTIITDSQRVKDPKKWKSISTMTERWRLVNGKELYDIKADPSQKKNVAAEHSDVVEQLRSDYESWWEDISPVFERDARIVVGSEAENPSHLTSHDWLTSERMVPWNQQQVRNGVPGKGAWALKVETAGRYRITLRRWPLPVKSPMTAGFPTGDPVPGAKAYREAVGMPLPIAKAGIRFAGKEVSKDVPAGAAMVEFEVDLSVGEVNVEGYYALEDGTETGSYYASVERL